MGKGDWLSPYFPADGKYFQSMFLPDQIINPHPRFRQRRGSKVEINTPIFHDVNTPAPFIDPSITWDRDLFPGDSEAKNGAAKPNHIYMDATGFGMGCCCLQVTFQASDLNEARRMYDQLAPITAIAMALSASTPILRGYLADTDCRWNIISSSVDDRTPEERGLKPLSGDFKRILKSRYGTIDSYLGSNDGFFREEFNDIDLVYDEESYKTLKDNGVDEMLAKHISHLFIRDPLVIYKELLDQDNEQSSDHFENIQSTNWQNLRFKPPPPNSDIGWRVEFRSMDIQLTDFENAAFSVFIALLTRAILSYDLDFYIPISKMDVNMERAHDRDAVLVQKFFFRKNIFPRKNILSTPHQSQSSSKRGSINSCDQEPNADQKSSNGSLTPVHIYEGEDATKKLLFDLNYFDFATINTQLEKVIIEEITLNEIMNGQVSSGGFPGLLPIVQNYLDSCNIDIESLSKLNKYLDFIKLRSSGALKTNARFFRDFVMNHPDYKNDSVVSEKIIFDLLSKCSELTDLNIPPS
ncbi:Glutamate-cysteine ligase [Smittium mucronatum]|uniref:Glutamate--cysteine ligase n=2 Tax=Smittium mucronatum TaxID=133383 RepID=A0A1R0H001_9FUNG|nr:Glutamate-cysteine ligase [Smittium mucronatum]